MRHQHSQNYMTVASIRAAMGSSRLIRSVLITSLILMASGVAALIFQPGADLTRAQTGGVMVGPGQGVEFQQVNFLFSAAPAPNSDWGRLSADPVRLSTATSLSSGYLNVFTNAGWVVQNLPVNLSDGQTPVTAYFRLGLTTPTPVSQLSAYIIFTSGPQPSFTDGPRLLFPVSADLWNAEGAGDAQTTAIGAAPPSNLVTFIPGGATSKHTQPGAVNVQTARNQCFPMSIANSLQYLENRFGITVPHDHTPGLKDDNSLVGQLDAKADRNAPARNMGSGVWFQPMLRGKFSYLDMNGLKDALVHKHQGRGYGDPALDQALPDGNFTSSGITSRDDGATVTWEWICDEIKKGQDVELVFSYDNALGQPTGGHAVRVFECGTTLGIPWIGYLHDRQQSNIDPLDNQGLEMVRVFTVDVDGDGMLNLGAPDREIRFALSESPVEVDQFPNSVAQITFMTPFGSETVALSGPTTVHVLIGPQGQAGDPDGDGQDQVETEMVQLELTGTSASLGPLLVRLRDALKHPFQRTRGEIEETANTQSGRLDLPPFASGGTASSFFDVFVEIELQNPPPFISTQLRRLHNDRPKRMQTTITHKPPARGETYESPEVIDLLDENDNPTGIQLGAAFHTPNPFLPVCSLTPPTATNIVNTSHTVTAMVTQGNNPVAGVTVNFTVTGANPTAGVATTDNNGQAFFTYIGTNTGSDTITASGSVHGLDFSCTAQKNWIPCIATCNVDPRTINFGQVCVGQSADRPVTVSNTGNVPVTISAITSSNPAFAVVSPALPATVPAGGSLSLTVRFTCSTSSGAPGQQSGMLSFTTTSLCGPVSCGTVTLGGTCLQFTCDLSPRTINFGQICPGQFADQVFTLRNLGNVLFTINTITSSNPAFSIVSPALPLNLNPGENAPVTVRFACTTPGAQSGTLSFSASSFCGPITCGVVTVSGTCLQFACDLSPRAIDFGTLCLGQSADRTTTVRNLGNQPFTLNAINSSNPAFTVVSPALPVTVPAGGNVPVTIRFTCSTSSGAPGSQNGTLSFSASGFCGPVECGVVTLSGFCAQVCCTVSPRAIDFGTLCLGQSADRTFTVSNCGNVPFTLNAINSNNASFTVVSPALPVTVQAGSSVTLTVRFTCSTSSGAPGQQSSTLSFNTSSLCGPVDCGTVTLSGFCAQVCCTVSPRTLDFGLLCLGQSTDRTLTVSNCGNVSFTLNAINSNNPAFTVVSPALPVTVPAGGSVPVTVRFTCTTLGQQNGTLSFNTSSLCGPVDCGTVSLTGFCAQICCNLSTRTLDFGLMCGGQSSDRTVTVSNCGTVSFTINSINSTNPAFTVVSPALPVTVPAGGSVPVTVRLNCSTSSGAPGSQNGTLSFNTSSLCGPVDCGTVSLTGFCAQACCTVSPRTVDFGTLCFGQSTDRIITVSNCGNVPFTINSINSNNSSFTVVSPALPVTVQAGSSVSLTVRFTCSTSVGFGQQNGTLSFNTSSLCGPVDCGIVNLTGFCAQVCCTVSPRTIDFGQVCQSESANRTFTVSNCGSVSFTLNSISSSNSAFTVVSPALPVTVPAGGSLTVTVRFICNSPGSQSSTLSFNTSSVCGPVDCGTVNLTAFCQQAVCTVSPTVIDFGSVPQGGSSDRTFTVSNPGNVSFTINAINSSNPAFAVVSPALPVAVPAGGSVTVTVRLNCTSSGSPNGTLSFNTNSVCGPVSCSTVTVRGTCVAPPANLTLMKTDSPDPATVGTDITYTVTITNNGPGTATNVRVTDTLPSSVTFVSSSSSQGSCSRSGNTVTCNLGTLTNGASATIMIVVTPRAAGMITNTASVASNEIDSDTSDNMASATTTVQVTPVPDIDVQPTSANFGNVQVGNTSSRDFTVRNTGMATLNVSATSLVGPDPGEFAITNGGGAFSLPPNGTRTVTVQFAPTSAGNKTATLRFTSDDPDENPKNVSLSGRGLSGGGGQMALVAADNVTVVEGLPGSGQILTTIPVPGNAREVAVAPNRRFALALTDVSQVTVIPDLSNLNAQTMSVDVGGDPVGVAISQDSSFAVVLVSTRPVQLVSITGLPNNPTVGTPFILSQVQSGAQDISLSAFGTVVASVSGNIAIVDGFQPGGTPALRGLLRVGSNPSGVAFTNDGSAAFFVSPAITAVFVITGLRPGQSPRLERPISNGAGPNPRAIRLSPDGSIAVVTNQGDNSASVFQVSGATLRPIGPVAVGNLPAGVSISGDGDTALVANATDETVFVITNLRRAPAVTAILGPGTQFRTLDDREQSVAFVP